MRNTLGCFSPLIVIFWWMDLVFIVLAKTAARGAKQQPDNTPKTCEYKIRLLFINPTMGSDWVFKGSSQLPIDTKWQLLRPSRETAVSREIVTGEWAQPLTLSRRDVCLGRHFTRFWKINFSDDFFPHGFLRCCFFVKYSSSASQRCIGGKNPPES